MEVNLENYKNNNKEYLKQLQILLDLVDNIQDENLRKTIVYQILKCEKELMQIKEEYLKEKKN